MPRFARSLRRAGRRAGRQAGVISHQKQLQTSDGSAVVSQLGRCVCVLHPASSRAFRIPPHSIRGFGLGWLVVGADRAIRRATRGAARSSCRRGTRIRTRHPRVPPRVPPPRARAPRGAGRIARVARARGTPPASRARRSGGPPGGAHARACRLPRATLSARPPPSERAMAAAHARRRGEPAGGGGGAGARGARRAAAAGARADGAAGAAQARAAGGAAVVRARGERASERASATARARGPSGAGAEARTRAGRGGWERGRKSGGGRRREGGARMPSRRARAGSVRASAGRARAECRRLSARSPPPPRASASPHPSPGPARPLRPTPWLPQLPSAAAPARPLGKRRSRRGDSAPGFDLPVGGSTVSLQSPGTPARPSCCTTTTRMAPRLLARGAALPAAPLDFGRASRRAGRVDGPIESHEGFCSEKGITFPLLSDERRTLGWRVRTRVARAARARPARLPLLPGARACSRSAPTVARALPPSLARTHRQTRARAPPGMAPSPFRCSASSPTRPSSLTAPAWCARTGQAHGSMASVKTPERQPDPRGDQAL